MTLPDDHEPEPEGGTRWDLLEWRLKNVEENLRDLSQSTVSGETLHLILQPIIKDVARSQGDIRDIKTERREMRMLVIAAVLAALGAIVVAAGAARRGGVPGPGSDPGCAGHRDRGAERGPANSRRIGAAE